MLRLTNRTGIKVNSPTLRGYLGNKTNPSSGPTVLILDQFTDVDGTALSAHTVAPTNTPGGSWDVLGYTITGNKAGISSATNFYAVGITTGLTDNYTASIVTSTQEAGVAVRVQDDAHNFFAVWDTANFRLYENNAGLSLRGFDAAVAAAYPQTITMQLSGNLITAKLYGNGVLASTLTYTSANFAASTKAGLSIRNLVNSFFVDDFTVTTP